MTPDQLHKRLYAIFLDMGVASTALTDQAHLTRDLGLDSLDITDLLLQVETAFTIRIADEDFLELVTFGALKHYISDHLPFSDHEA
jgi:acyl carrier protein